MKMTNFYWFSVLFACFGYIGNVHAVPMSNPRSGAATTATVRSDSGTTPRSAAQRNSTGSGRVGNIANTSRSTVTVRKAPAVAMHKNVAPVSARSATTGAVARSAILHSTSVARSATTANAMGPSRSSTARATSVFDDISKMGSGYATCRDAYSTCMDQLCAKANETYRRCFCSSRFTDFRNTELALDEAKVLLQRFEDNSLNAVDKSAAEVNAMYTATVGEAAIKKDTSAAQNTLSEISDLLSGKKKASTNNSSTSLGVLSLDFSTDIDDIWSGSNNSASLFDSKTADISELEGVKLFNQANAQCLNIIADSCENSAVLNMAKSSYSILISQDCNAYEKKIDTQREAVMNTVRQAEKILRDARLEEYRSHNSADVNECIGKVKSAMLADTACGDGYKRCLDYTGAYVSATTGEAIYSPRLFKLNDLIKLDGNSSDVLGKNTQFNKFLDDRRMFAQTALDTCRDMQDIVWTEFKRSALIEIAQAQDVLIENVKSSCVSTMKECYDTQSDALKSFDDTTAQAAGALSAYAAKAMCEDKVIACAALYGNGEQTCNFNDDGKLTGDNSKCGLAALLAYVNTVDNVRVAEGCATAIDNYVKELCTPTVGDMSFPWNCRKKNLGKMSDNASDGAEASVVANIKNFAIKNCSDPTDATKTYEKLPIQTRTQVEKAISDIQEQMDYQLMETCETLGGYWLDSSNKDNTSKLLVAFYSSVYGNSQDNISWGKCVENSVKVQCEANNTGVDTPVATYDLNRDECIFTDSWYKMKCESMGGYYENATCYIAKDK